MKTLMLNTYCHAEKCETFSNSFTVTLSDELIKRIKRMAEFTDTGVFDTAEASSFEGVWSTYIYDRSGEPDSLHENELESIRVDMCDMDTQVENPKVRVTGKHFYFTAIPKFCDESDKVFTESVLLDELNNDTVYVRL